PASRVRIPPSPPLQIKKAPVERLGPFLFVCCERSLGRTLWFDQLQRNWNKPRQWCSPKGQSSPVAVLINSSFSAIIEKTR
ncbi:MAG: hypothetical protein ACI9I4_002226, partial [Neolewinella sp.]